MYGDITKGLCAAVVALTAATAAASADDTVKIGVLSDFNGYTSPIAGEGSLIAVQMAVEDAGGTVAGKNIEIVSADHQNKADVGSSLARRWFDTDGVDMIVDIPNSAVALAVQDLAKKDNKVALHTAAGTSALTGSACSPNGVHWARDSYAYARSIAAPVVQQGGDTWFFITADYAFGQAMKKDVGAIVEAEGGKILGEVDHPAGTADFSSFLLQAQASGAKVVAVANAGTDTTNAIRQANEFGLGADGEQRLVALVIFITDVHGLGLPSVQRVRLSGTFYWNLDDETTAWSRRFYERHGAMPTTVQANAYSAVRHYLKALEALGDENDGKAVVAKMKDLKVEDQLTSGYIRSDGRLVRDMYLFETKTPEESTEDWDFYKVLATIDGETLVRSLAEGGCEMGQ